LIRRAIAVWEKHGGTHPHLAVAWNNLAQNYRIRKRFLEAEPLYRKSLSLHEELVGRGAALSGLAAANFAEYMVDTGRTAAAVKLYRRSLDALEGSWGREHPQTRDVASRLALVSARLRRETEALVVSRDAEMPVAALRTID
jgi:hypothetical protein